MQLQLRQEGPESGSEDPVATLETIRLHVSAANGSSVIAPFIVIWKQLLKESKGVL